MDEINKSRLQEVLNEATVQYVGVVLASHKTEDILPNVTPLKK